MRSDLYAHFTNLRKWTQHHASNTPVDNSKNAIIYNMEITLTGSVPPKKNSKQWIVRGGKKYQIPSDRHKAWHDDAWFQLIQQKAARDRITDVELTMTFFVVDNRKRDLTNMAESVNDLLVDFNVIDDDAWQVCPKITLTCAGIDRKNPRVVIDIQKTAS
jgi:Holliday junction resolvase RusA-like endonuclease